MDESYFLEELYILIDRYFSLNELMDLYLLLNVEFGKVPGRLLFISQDKYVKARELVMWADRLGLVDVLVARCQQLRPHVEWPKPILSKVRDLIVNHFDLKELKTICFDLGIDFESLSGEGKPGKVRELVLLADRIGEFDKLVAYCQELRPHATWPELVHIHIGGIHFGDHRTFGGDIHIGRVAGRDIVTRTWAVRSTPLRLDTALPSQVTYGRSFELAVAICQPDSPILQEEELDKTKSSEMQVTWPEDSNSIPLRIHVSAPECAIANDTHSFRLTKGQDSPVFYFQLTPQQTGRIGIVVTVYQEVDWLGGTRLHTVATEQPVGAVTIEVKSHSFDQMALVEQIKHHFSPAELRLLCEDLRVFYHDIRGENYTEQVLELLRYMVRRGRVPELLEQCQKLRPHVNWLALADIVPVGEG